MGTTEDLIRQLRAPDQRGAGRIEEAEYGVPNVERLTRIDNAAKSIRSWNSRCIPGLLQTPEYMMGLTQATNPHLPLMEVRKRTLLKSARTQAFMRRTMTGELGMAWFLVGEQGIIHSTRDTNAHAMQLRHLLTMSGHAKIMIQVLPAHKIPPALSDHFLLWGLEEESADPDGPRIPPQRMGYIETIMGGWYSTRLDDVARMHSAFSDMIREAMSPDDSRTFIREVLASWRALQSRTSPDSTTEPGSSSPATPTTTALELPPQHPEM
ncbi:DUF5753 domain-containing protein [Streptomyces sp. NPDC048825]|uniref:DUF5753 domain-containing protein n=1 Tax=Streptomyces sp. NPDC048825 TaxID=3365592 RepID=UPI0037196E7A